MSKVSAEFNIQKSFGNDEPIDIDQFSKKKNRNNKSRVKMNPLNISEDLIIHEPEAEKAKNQN